jgi:hypothetical protein
MKSDDFTEEEFELAVKILERIAEKYYQEAVLQGKDPEEPATSGTVSAGWRGPSSRR